MGLVRGTLRVLGIVALATAAVFIGIVWPDRLVAQFSGFDLRRIAGLAPAYQPPPVPPPRWRRYAAHGVEVLVPPEFVRRQPVSSAAEALIVTNRRQTVWVSVTVRPASSRWAVSWYRMCLRAQQNPVGLMGKAILMPPLGTRAPRCFEQPLGPWQAFLAMDPHRRRLIAELFHDRAHVTAVLVARHDGLLDLDTARAILASIRVASDAARPHHPLL